MERLDKIIASATGKTRSEIKKMISSRLVTINGMVQTDPGKKVRDDEEVELQGEKISKGFVYIMMNKPQKVVSSTKDSDKTVIDLLPDKIRKKNVFPVGRLDKDTVGLLLITDDGALGHILTSPKHHREKVYRVTLDKPFNMQDSVSFQKGLVLRDGTVTKPAEILPEDEKTVSVRLTEGKYHQVKRMFAALGYHVEELERTEMAGLRLDPSLERGEWRYLKNNEIRVLKGE